MLKNVKSGRLLAIEVLAETLLWAVAVGSGKNWMMAM